MKEVKSIAVIGAGLSGLVTAKTCLEYGYNVKVFEKHDELGGVWASSRRYPGLTTQNPKDTYAFSDFPMPKHFDEWPTGEQMLEYLTAYATKFKILPSINFSHLITEVSFGNNRWMVTGKNKGVPFMEYYDFLIVCNGTFCEPCIPKIPGMETFTDAGGKILHTTQFNSTTLSENKRTVIVGYNKSATDVAVVASETAQNTHMIVREVKWKIPRFVKGLNAKYIFLNRLGEAVISPFSGNKVEKFVHRLGLPKKMLSGMEKYLTKKQKLHETGLYPSCKMKDLIFAEVSIETPGFFDKVFHKKINPVHGEIVSISGKNLLLSDGNTLEADLLIFGTGFHQTIPFLPDKFMNALTDEHGHFMLHRHILPAGIPSLAFVGYNPSLYSNLTSEIGALWVCEYLKGNIEIPSDEEIITERKKFINWRSGFRMNGDPRAISVAPWSIKHVDELLKDMNASVPLFDLIHDWLVVLDPSHYKKVKEKIMKRSNTKENIASVIQAEVEA